MPSSVLKSLRIDLHRSRKKNKYQEVDYIYNGSGLLSNYKNIATYNFSLWNYN